MAKRHYSAQQKNFALQVLKEKAGDVALVSHLLAIPERTLFRWRKAAEWQDWQDWQKNSSPPIVPMSPTPPTTLTPNPESLSQTAFGMTREELEEALKAEYIESEYTTIHQQLMQHIKILNANLSDDPDLAHRRALAIHRLLDSALTLEPLLRLEKPEVSIVKYEYPDQTYHDLPYFDNRIYDRADQAYHAVIEQAKRQYYAEKGYNMDAYFNYGEELNSNLTPEEIIAQPFAPDDFTNEPQSYYAKLLMGKRDIPDDLPPYIPDNPASPYQDPFDELFANYQFGSSDSMLNKLPPIHPENLPNPNQDKEENPPTNFFDFLP